MSTNACLETFRMSEKVHFFEEYRLDNPQLFENNIVSSFFESPMHITLFGIMSCNPTIENKRNFEVAFQRFFFCIRFTSYISSMIRFADIDYHRKRKKKEERNQLIFDSPVGEEGQVTLGEYLMSLLPRPSSILPTSNPQYFEAKLEDPHLCSVFSKLTDRQKMVVTLSYSTCELDTEIARMLNVTQQAITKTRISALNKMRKDLQAQVHISSSRKGVS